MCCVIRNTRHTYSTAQNSNEKQDEKRSENEKRSGCRLCVCTSTTLYWKAKVALSLMAAAASDASTAPVPLTFGPFEPLSYALPQEQRSAPHIFGRMRSPKFGFKTSFFKLSGSYGKKKDSFMPPVVIIYISPIRCVHQLAGLTLFGAFATLLFNAHRAGGLCRAGHREDTNAVPDVDVRSGSLKQSTAPSMASSTFSSLCRPRAAAACSGVGMRAGVATGISGKPCSMKMDAHLASVSPSLATLPMRRSKAPRLSMHAWHEGRVLF